MALTIHFYTLASIEFSPMERKVPHWDAISRKRSNIKEEDNQVLCILTSERVLRTLFAG